MAAVELVAGRERVADAVEARRRADDGNGDGVEQCQVVADIAADAQILGELEVAVAE